MSRLFISSGIIVAAMTQPAAALWIDNNDGSFTYVPDGLIILGVLAAVVGSVFLAMVSGGNSGPPPREKTPDEYNAEAVLFAARRHHTEMQTELRKAEIEAARVDAVHKERNEIVAHDKKVRDLNARLDERRRAS
jgi:hypothetical protein